MKKAISLFLITVFSIVLLIIISGTVFVYFPRKDEPFDDSDLLLSAVEVQEKDNAFYDLNRAVEELKFPREREEMINKIIKGKGWNKKFVENTLEQNKEALSFFEKGIALPVLQFPEFQDPKQYTPETRLPSVREYRRLADIVALKSLFFFEKGEEEKAFDEALKIVKFGELMQNSPRTFLILYLVGMSIENRGLSVIKILTEKTSLPSEIIRKYAEKIDSDFKFRKEKVKELLKGEYMTIANTIDRYGRTKKVAEEITGNLNLPIYLKIMIKSPYFYKPNQTKKLYFEMIQKQIKNFDKDYYEEVEPMSYDEVEEIFLNEGEILSENSIGKLFFSLIFFDVGESFFSKICEMDFYAKSTNLLMVIKAYKSEEGKIPDSLSELVPEYISEIPEDCFNGEPIKYSPSKKIIYSVGGDLLDSGGNMQEEEYFSKMDDPTVRINF